MDGVERIGERTGEDAYRLSGPDAIGWGGVVRLVRSFVRWPNCRRGGKWKCKALLHTDDGYLTPRLVAMQPVWRPVDDAGYGER